MAFDGRGPDSAVSGPCARIIHDRLSSHPSTPSSFSYPSPSSSTSDLRSRPPSYSETIMHGPHRTPSTSSLRPRPLPVPPTSQPSPLIPSMPSRPSTPLSPSRPSSASSTATSFFRPLPTVPVSILEPAPPPRANAAPLDLTMLAPPAGPLSPDAVSSLSPCGPPPPPPPHEIRRQNLSKLRRYLGQSVPPALVYRHSKSSSGDSSGDEGKSSEEVTFRVHLEQEDEVDETRREGGQQAPPGPRPAICEAEAARAGTLWMREQNGKRWVEEDFGEVLHTLRNLR